LKCASGLSPDVVHGPPRPGDVRDSLADIGAAGHAFQFAPAVGLDQGLAEYVDWARAHV
jgi:UDP-glucose 4-epimerase